MCSEFVSFCKECAKRENERRKGIISKTGHGEDPDETTRKKMMRDAFLSDLGIFK